MCKRTVLVLLLMTLFLFGNAKSSHASTTQTTYQQMDLATLYWIYFGTPLPRTDAATASAKIPVPIPTMVTPILHTASVLPAATTPPTATLTEHVSIPNTSSSFIAQINVYRATQGLSPVQTDSNTCAFAKTRAGEITSGFSHDGFTSRINNHTLPYPGYHEITENIAMNSDPSQVIQGWINSPGHAENMRKDTPYVCVQSSGNYYAYEGWKP